MIAALFELLAEVSPWAVVIFSIWALWALAGLSVWTWAAMVTTFVYPAGAWTWTPSACLDAAAIVAVLCYLLECAKDPRSDCKWCKGTPRRRNEQGNWHWCLFCGGKGYRVRFGARLAYGADGERD